VEFFGMMDAANIDLKAFSERFYRNICGGRLAPVLETIQYVYHETQTWLELTTLLIPGENDSADEIEKMSRWIVERLGPEVPLHFTAFHADWKMRDIPDTPAATLTRARMIARESGLHYVYTGNVHDPGGSSTYCPNCSALLIERDWYQLGHWGLVEGGLCGSCKQPIAGHFDLQPGGFGARRIPVRMQDRI
jgi:pyruvate formate lyase activating enzyme